MGRIVRLLLVGLAFGIFGYVPAALGASSYSLDPALSLTGDCSVSKLDPVPDPVCDLPSGRFSSPRSVATDSYGNIYVADYGDQEGLDGRIYIFDFSGRFITEIPDSAGPKNLVVDSQGNLYVFEFRSGNGRRVLRFTPDPTAYEPQEGKIAYEASPVVVDESIDLGSAATGLAVNPENDHLYVHHANYVVEFGSAAEGNKVLDSTIGQGTFDGSNTYGASLAIDSMHGRIYASDFLPNVIRVFDLNAPHALLQTIDGSTTPAGDFGIKPTVAVDEASGHVLVYDGDDGSVPNAVYEFTGEGDYVSSIENGIDEVFGAQIGVDNGPFSPNQGYVYVPSVVGGVGHSLAFGPSEEFPPSVEATGFSEVTDREARLWAEVNPGGLETHYVFEYLPEEQFEQGTSAFSVASEGNMSVGKATVEVEAFVSQLNPGTAYRFRVRATNALGNSEQEGQFSTYSLPAPLPPCVNEALRAGTSKLLPDCRAYELVTPPSTNARTPRGVDHAGALYFSTLEASPSGERVSFLTEGGSLPGTDATGSLHGDPYLAERGQSGWNTSTAGPDGAESAMPLPGSTSVDQTYSFWQASGLGSANTGDNPFYIRYPDGHSALIGRGSLGSDTQGMGRYISENGAHIIFRTHSLNHFPRQLEPVAPPDGTEAVYDRTSDEVTHVISLLPGNVTPASGEDAAYVGVSRDGKGVAFSIGDKLYLRHNNEATYEAGESVTFAGVAEGGGRILYLKNGDLYALDISVPGRIRFTKTGNVTPVNISADGSTAFFISTTAISSGHNPEGASPMSGKQNLYASREGTISFIGTVTPGDVEGASGGNEVVGGLGLWMSGVSSGRLGADPSRTTPDGDTLLFESRAQLTNYDPKGYAQVYRYDLSDNFLLCLSCNPTQASATSDASLQSVAQAEDDPEPFSSFALIDNLRFDGSRAFFQSSEPLVVGDTDGLQDVYEWEAAGVGTCTQAPGCTHLISSGHSNRIDYLYAVSDSGDDVFFRSSDLLLSSDAERIPSIYDARVGGGFPGEAGGCPITQDCGSSVTAAPHLQVPASVVVGPSGNVRSPPKRRRCHKRKRRVRRHGESLCVKRHRRSHAKNMGVGK